MINVDTVYQKVLVLANKEQRGYITPQEFNLLADKAQMDIYTNYFHNLKTTYHKPIKTQIGTSGDEMEMLQAKLHPFKKSTSFTQEANDMSASLPSDLYFIDVLRKSGITSAIVSDELVEITKKELVLTQNNPLLEATTKRMVYVREEYDGTNHVITIYPQVNVPAIYEIHYYKVPTAPAWGYVVVNNKALYNNSTSIDFLLHPSEEETLVTRILELSGLLIRSEELAQAAMVDRQNTKQEQNS